MHDILTMESYKQDFSTKISIGDKTTSGTEGNTYSLDLVMKDGTTDEQFYGEDSTDRDSAYISFDHGVYINYGSTCGDATVYPWFYS